MIYYYAMIIHHEAQGPIPICEMLTSDQTTPNLTYCFLKWLRSLHEVSTNCAKKIKHIEIDQSWALLHSTCQSFNKTSLLGYLEKSWKILNSKEEFSITTIHFCSAHVIHRFCVILRDISTPSKSTFRYATSCFATLQNCTSLNQGIELFNLICLIFTSRTKHTECLTAMIRMDQFMESMNESVMQDDDNIQFDTSLFSEQNPSNILREQSPFYHCFTQIANEMEKTVHSSMGTVSNPHYCPDFITLLLKRYLYLFPLWTGSILALSQTKCGNAKLQTRETNSIVEKWMGIVKHNILQKSLHLRPGDFLRQMHVNITQRISGLLFNIPKSSKQRRKRNEENSEEAIEIWRPKKRKSNYYHNPVLSSHHSHFSKLTSNLENSTDFTIKIPIEYYSTNNRSNLNYESDSAYEYHDLEDHSCNLHSPVTSLECHTEIVSHKPKEIDHPYVPSQKMWLKALGLTVHDHKSLLSETGWLGSSMIWAAQTIMREQFSLNNSFQDTLYSQRVKSFHRAPLSERNVQIHHTGIAHWVTSAAIDGKVLLMDSLYLRKVSIQLEEQLTSIYVSNGTEFIINVINVDQQNDSSSCGPYAIAFAYHTAMGDDLSQICFEQQKLRKHIEMCMINRKFSSFPQQKVNRQRICHTKIIKIATCCQRTENLDDLILCDSCQEWKHLSCEDIKGLLEAPKNLFCKLCKIKSQKC